MQFSTLVSLASVIVSAIAANSFTAPLNNTVVEAGSNFVVRWQDTDGVDQINLLLRQGDPNNLNTVLTIASGISNRGAVQWSVPSTIPSGSDYAIEIQDTSDVKNVNYSPFFTIHNNRTFTTTHSSTVATTSSVIESNTTTVISTTSTVANTTVAVSTTAASSSKSSNTAAAGVGSSKSAASLTSSGVTTLATSASSSAVSGSAVGANATASHSHSASSSENSASTWGSSVFAAGLAVAAALAL